MKTWVRRSLNVGVLGAGFLLVSGAAAAQADQVSGPNAGIASGNQLSSVLQLPIDISGNAVSVLGFADASSVGGAGAVNTESASTTEAGQVSGFNSGILTGNQVSSVVQVPVSVCGNSIAVLGFANASCVGGAGAVNGGGGGLGNGGWDRGDWDDNGDGQGNGGYGDTDDNDYGDTDDDGYGGSSGGGYGMGGGRATRTHHHHGEYGQGSGGHGMGGGAHGTSRGPRAFGGGGGHALSDGGADQVTGYNAGVLTGNQVSSVIQAPIDVSGNAIALFGFASASSVGGAGASNESASTTEAGQVSGFNAGFLTGNQISSVVQVPISVCGNSIAILGFADASCVGGAAAVNGGGGWDNGGNWTRPVDDDDDAGNAGGPYDPYDPSGTSTGRPMASGHGAHGASKAAKKAGKKAKHADEHGSFGARGHHGTSAGGNASGGYGGSSSGGDDYDYGHGSGSGSGNGNGGGGSWGGNCGPDQITGFNAGLLSGNQFSNVAQVPIDISGNAISILGFASARSVGGAAAVNC
jgi:hypothetical protein